MNENAKIFPEQKRPGIVTTTLANKGGVGKTTTTNIFAQLSALIGKRTLVIDIDPEGHLSKSLGCRMEDSEAIIKGMARAKNENIMELFRYRYRTCEDVHKCIYETSIPNLHIIPSSKRHETTEKFLFLEAASGNINIILKRALNCIRKEYDYIFIDTPPALGVLPTNCIFASDYVITPITKAEYSADGLYNTLNSIYSIKEEYDIENPVFKGAFLTMDDARTNRSRRLKETMTSELKANYIPFAIPQEDMVQDLDQEGKSIAGIMLRSRAILNYIKVLLYLDILDSEGCQKLKTLLSEEEMKKYEETKGETCHA